MDKKSWRGPSHFNKGNAGNHSRGRNSRRERRRQRNRFQDNYDENDAVSTTSSSVGNTSTENVNREIPGYFYDAKKNRYFKINNDHPKNSATQEKPSAVSLEAEYKGFKSHSESHSRPCHYVQVRELSGSHSANVLKRKGLECWARQVVEQKHFTLAGAHPRPIFKGCISNVALSSSCDKMVTVTKLSGLDCDTINVYNVNHDREDFISPKMLATIIASEVTHVEWNPNENMENYFLLNLLGSEKSKGCGLVCKFNESLQLCEFNSYPLANGTAWHCSWCQNPQYSHLLGIAGSKQAVLIDSEKKTSLCRIGSPSDIFCVEFCHRCPVIYLGSRNGDIMCVDIRMKSGKQSRPLKISTTSPSSVTCVKIMQDENYLMGSNLDGTVKMWDIRLSKPVKEYHGNVNETKLIPFVMDSSQSIISSAGQDGKTRIWSIGSCELLKTIDYPDVTSENLTVPPVCLGENWGDKGGMMGFGLGVNDKLHIYY